MAQGPPKGTTNNRKGRTKGTPNKTTTEAKQLMQKVLYGQLDNLNQALEDLRIKDSAKYLDILSKWFTYVIPKKTDVTTDGEKITPSVNITVQDKETAKILKDMQNEND